MSNIETIGGECTCLGCCKKREKKRRLDNAVAGTSKIRNFFVTTTAGEDETSEGNPEHSKRDAVDVAPSVPAPGDESAAEPTTAEPATAEPTTVEPRTIRAAKLSLLNFLSLFRD